MLCLLIITKFSKYNFGMAKTANKDFSFQNIIPVQSGQHDLEV